MTFLILATEVHLQQDAQSYVLYLSTHHQPMPDNLNSKIANFEVVINQNHSVPYTAKLSWFFSRSQRFSP